MSSPDGGTSPAGYAWSWPAAVPLRAIWGTVLLFAPSILARRPAHAPSRTARRVVRLLGARHVLQAVVTARYPAPALRRWGAAADGLHAATAVAVAVRGRGWRAQALTDATVASAFALAAVPRPRR